LIFLDFAFCVAFSCSMVASWTHLYGPYKLTKKNCQVTALSLGY